MKNLLLQSDALSALKKLLDNSIDVGVTSPPYNKQENKKGWLVNNVKYDVHRDKLPESEYQDRQVNVLNELYRVIKPGGSFFYNHKVRWERGDMLHPMSWILKSKWNIRQEIIWDRKIAANIRGWRFWQVEERIYWLNKPVNGNKIGDELKSCHAKLSSIWRFSPERNNPHPAPFPIVLPLRAINSVMEGREGTVIDPYCGSGTTCVAAKLLNLNYVGIDVSETYLNMAEERIKNFESERHIWEKEKANYIIKETFSERKNAGKNVGRYGSVVNG